MCPICLDLNSTPKSSIIKRLTTNTTTTSSSKDKKKLPARIHHCNTCGHVSNLGFKSMHIGRNKKCYVPEAYYNSRCTDDACAICADLHRKKKRKNDSVNYFHPCTCIYCKLPHYEIFKE